MTQTDAVEPRGDLDVMLKMHAQGMLTPSASSGPSTLPMATTAAAPALSPGVPTSATSSLRAVSPQLTRPSSVAVSALRGFFGASRPRSPSTATVDTQISSISERSSSETPQPPEDASFGRAGTNLLSMLRTGPSVGGERPLSPTSFGPSVPPTPRVAAAPEIPLQTATLSPPPPLLDQKILQDKDRESLLPSITRNSTAGGALGLGLTGMTVMNGVGNAFRYPANGGTANGSPSLQPPPRRRAYTASGTPPSSKPFGETGYTYSHTNTSTAETLGVRHNGSAFLSPRAPSLAPSSSTSHTTSPSPASPSPRSSPTLSNRALHPEQNGGGSIQSVSHSQQEKPQREGRKRFSWSSASSFGSGEARGEPQPAALEFGSMKRWSRQGIMLPKRLSPPAGPPPTTPPHNHATLPPSPPSNRTSFRQQQRHPYAVDSPPSRSPSTRSTNSPHSIMSGLQSFSKRASVSGSSVQSDSTVGTTHSHVPTPGATLGSPQLHPLQTSPQRPRSSHRTSMPPPQRPVPSIALPPTPGEEHANGELFTRTLPRPAPLPERASGYPRRPPHSAPAFKSSFRESFSLRSHRFSLAPPTLPPSTKLPPRPDEAPTDQVLVHHRRSTSSGSGPLAPIPASPIVFDPQAPPNVAIHTIPGASSSRPTSLLKRRLRLLSSPSPMPPPSNPLPNPPSPAPSTINPYKLPRTPSGEVAPGTPIGEPITTLQNDPSFLLTTPPTPLLSSPQMIPLPRNGSFSAAPPPEQSPDSGGIVSLLPPPRRASKQINMLRVEPSPERVVRVEGDGNGGQLVEVGPFIDMFDDVPRSSPAHLNNPRLSFSLSPRQSSASLPDDIST